MVDGKRASSKQAGKQARCKRAVIGRPALSHVWRHGIRLMIAVELFFVDSTRVMAR